MNVSKGSYKQEQLQALEAREENLNQWEYNQYSYNALAKFMVLAEKPTKEFYARVKRETGQTIEALADQAGCLKTEPQEILEVAASFYEDLYSKRNTNEEDKQHMLSKLNKQAARIKTRFRAREVQLSICRAASGKSLGIDGLMCELYKMLLKKRPKTGTGRPLITKILAKLFNEINKLGLFDEWTEGILTLLHKKDETNQLKNYRPLSLMNINYKLYTECLVKRFVKDLDTIIGKKQSAFLPKRLINDNIYNIQLFIVQYKYRQ